MFNEPPTPDGTTRESPSPGIFTYIVRFIKAAGGKTEAKTKRDGFLSYHAESHALGMGTAAGYLAVAHGEKRLLGMVIAGAVHGQAHAKSGRRRRIFKDIVEEPHYALFGIVMGGVLGAVANVATGGAAPDIPELLSTALGLLSAVMAGV